MPLPRLHDDGQVVTLDLHGARRDEAVRLVTRLVPLAARRGRAQVKLIHGHSTSQAPYRTDSIRHDLYNLLDSRPLSAYVRQQWRQEGYLLLALDLTARPDPTPIQLRDLR
jgi:DNA-nicking Smr family endonuclease